MLELETVVRETKKKPQALPGVTKGDVTVVVPVLNEEHGVDAVLDEIIQNGYQNILFVDGYSTDNTARVAQRKGVDVVTQHCQGKTSVTRTAIDTVSTQCLLVMDGDYNSEVLNMMNRTHTS